MEAVEDFILAFEWVIIPALLASWALFVSFVWGGAFLDNFSLAVLGALIFLVLSPRRRVE